MSARAVTPAPARRTPWRLAIALGIVACLLLTWLSLGVGIIGKDGDRANALYAAVLAVAAVGTLVARLRPAGMARVLVGMAAVQAAIAVFAVATGLGAPYDSPLKTLLLNGFFVACFLASAWLFRRAARA